MKEYVEKAAVEEMLENAQIIAEGEYCGYCTDDIDLNSIPTADVAPVRHGTWTDIGSLSCRCSECGCKNNRTTLYCPNCGARMDKEDEHEGVH